MPYRNVTLSNKLKPFNISTISVNEINLRRLLENNREKRAMKQKEMGWINLIAIPGTISVHKAMW